MHDFCRLQKLISGVQYYLKYHLKYYLKYYLKRTYEHSIYTLIIKMGKRPKSPNGINIWHRSREMGITDFVVQSSLTRAIFLIPWLLPRVAAGIERNGAPRLSYWADPSIGSRNIFHTRRPSVSLNLHPAHPSCHYTYYVFTGIPNKIENSGI